MARENNAVMSGILQRPVHSAEDFSRYRLRRSAHRLEKGFSVYDGREVFASAYIGAAVEDFKTLVESPAFKENNPDEFAYFVYTLDSYFRLVTRGVDVKIDAARALYGRLRPADIAPATMQTANEVNQLPFEALRDFVNSKHSVRHFLERPVDPGLLDECIELAGRAPSACNRQPFRYEVLIEREAISRYKEVSIGLSGFSDYLPCVILVVGELRAFEGPSDRHLPFVDGALSTMLLLLALHAKGLGSCIVNWPDTEAFHEGARRIIGLDDDQFVTLSIVAGHPCPESSASLQSPRKALDAIRRLVT